MTPPLLLLWDIDGTLLQRASLEHAEAMRAALTQVHGSLVARRHSGRGGGPHRRGDRARPADRRRPRVGGDRRARRRRHRRVLRRSTTSSARPTSRRGWRPACPRRWRRWAARPDAFRFSLVTGNFERIARLKLARAGIGDWFPEGQGGFGSDAEDRALLPPIARERAGGLAARAHGRDRRHPARHRLRAGGRAAGRRGGDGAVRGRGAGRRGRGRSTRRQSVVPVLEDWV